MENDKRISPVEIRTRLEKIPDDDLKLFGLNADYVRPEWMVLTVMAIPPVTMRPSITLENGERSEDDLTHKLGDIVRINQRLFENINAGAPEIIIEDLWDLLQYHITTFFDNSIAQLPVARHRSGQPLKTITERIKSKDGRIRHNLAGKRTNFSARTVISPDPNIRLNEVGVPQRIATNITVPERVTSWNIDYLKKFVEKGPSKYPGANYIVRPDGKKKRITDETKEASLEELKPGYLVERHLIDGDMSAFNRQPSLHRMSMMCHIIRVLPGRTLRLNPAVCHPFNADFDGDEMNLHVPQTEESRAEAELLMQVQTQLISPRYGLSVMGCVQDAISGNYLLTRENKHKREDAMQLLYQAGVTDLSDLPTKEIVSGIEIFSLLLPKDFNYDGHSRQCKDKCDSTTHVVIKNGKLISGIMDKSNLGEEVGLLLRSFHKKYGPDKTVEFLERLYKIGIETLQMEGLSVAISDTDLSPLAKQKVNEIITKATEDVKEQIRMFRNKELETFPGKSMKETVELKIMDILNKARNNTGEAVSKYCDKKSHTMVMADSGARGNTLNLTQMAACVGQQAMRGKRIEKGYSGRTLSCYQKDDLMPKAHGFIDAGFKDGLSPQDFFFASITGRDSLMDTALRTPKSGYLYRRLANATQDLRVEYDYTVRDSNNKIIQFEYGEDGIDVSKSEQGVINIKNIINSVR
jgi:DNA-directed RNA polymerase subunit A'